MIERVGVIAGLVLAIAGAPALARDLYECKFPLLGGNMNWLPDMVMLAREEGADTVTVVDGYIQAMEGGPIDVRIAEENDAKLSVSWPLMLQNTTNGYVKVQYRISIQKGSLSASLSGLPLGFSNNFTAQGRCKRMQG